MPQPYPTPENITTLMDVMTYSNNVTDHFMGSLFIIVIGAALFILTMSKGYSISQSTLFSCMGALILGIFFWVLGLVLGQFIIVILSMTVLAMIWNIFEK